MKSKVQWLKHRYGRNLGLGLVVAVLAHLGLAYDVVSDPIAEAHLADELKAWQEQSMQMQHQLSTLQNQYLQLQHSTANVSNPTFSNTNHLMTELADLISKQNQLSYNSQGLDRYFQNYFPGYQAPSDYQSQYQSNTQQTLTLINNALHSFNLSASDFQNENSRLQAIQHQAASVQGQTQALQTIAEIASEMVGQVQLLRQVLMSQANSQSAYEATQLQSEASREAALVLTLQKGCQEVARCQEAGTPSGAGQ